MDPLSGSTPTARKPSNCSKRTASMLQRSRCSSKDGTVTASASPERVAEAWHMTQPPRRTDYDLVIVGAGPAGLAAAVYAASDTATPRHPDGTARRARGRAFRALRVRELSRQDARRDSKGGLWAGGRADDSKRGGDGDATDEHALAIAGQAAAIDPCGSLLVLVRSKRPVSARRDARLLGQTGCLTKRMPRASHGL